MQIWSEGEPRCARRCSRAVGFAGLCQLASNIGDRWIVIMMLPVDLDLRSHPVEVNFKCVLARFVYGAEELWHDDRRENDNHYQQLDECETSRS